MNNLLNQGKKLFSRHPKVVFVFSAGNKKENTDVDLHYPSSIILDNVISVGASDENGNDFAYFTNFGKKTVTLMGPGIAIDSCSPGDKYLPINGTSQAAPQVTNTIANMMAIAESKDRVISPRTIKAILIRSSTKYKSLREKSVSGGVLNTKKAYQLTREHLRKH